MNINKILNFRIVFMALIVMMLASSVIAETIYVDNRNGNDANPGSKEKPLHTINQAAVMVSNSNARGPTTIKIAPGVYNLTKAVVFENTRPYTKEKRLTIEATVLPDDPQWKPAVMPVILSTEDPGKPDVLTETHSLKIKTSYVTIRGLKFLGNPSSNNWHGCIERIGKGLDDLLITQCMFIGYEDAFDIYSAALATGNKFVVEHCVFYNCHASTVYWDGFEGIGSKDCAMRYCIVADGYISGVWTCQTAEDFEFHHNIITRTEYSWMRKSGDQQKYRLHDCIVTNNKYYSGYGNAGGPTGQTGAEVTFEEKTVTKEGKVILEKDKKVRNYLHPVPGTLGSDLGAGLFKKKQNEN
ncbi:MAG: right-handed parallel beta-helix repeat-containing protein [Planctomycetota bacterium]|jgi:hypothetical protein